MADVLDQLQEQEDLIHRLHIQAVRQQLSVKGESLAQCECCGNRIQERRQRAIPGVRTCTECQRVLEIQGKKLSEVNDGKQKNQCDGSGENWQR